MEVVMRMIAAETKAEGRLMDGRNGVREIGNSVGMRVIEKG